MWDTCIIPLPAEEVAKLGDYCVANSTPLPQSIRDVAAKTANETGIYGQMACSLVQCSWLMSTTKLLRPKRVLELGTFTGVSTLAFYEATQGTNAEIITIELDKEYARMARRAFEKYGAADRVELMEMTCAEVLQNVKGQFDLIYVDADEAGYEGYLRSILDRKLLSPHGIILVDNTLIAGFAVDEEISTKVPAEFLESYKEAGAQLRQFNKFVSNDRRITCTLMPAFDGIMYIQWNE